MLLAIASFVILVVMMLYVYNIAVTLPIYYNSHLILYSILSPPHLSIFLLIQYVGEGEDQTIMLVMKHFVNLSPK